jgi:hypothetical protein
MLQASPRHHRKGVAMPTNLTFTCTARLLVAWLITPACNAAVLDALPLTGPSPSTMATTTTSALPEQPGIDLGYLRVEAEACVPLGPAQRSITEWAASTHALTTREALLLNFNWRQIQHYRADHGSAHELCYYPAP